MTNGDTNKDQDLHDGRVGQEHGIHFALAPMIRWISTKLAMRFPSKA
jgi:hypothetical protein